MVRARATSLCAAARAAAIAGLIALAACAPQIAREGLTNNTPVIAPDAFVTRDGLHLPLRHWDADHPRAIVVALHGMSDYSEAFDMPGPWWAQHGITTFAFDQRGFGGTPNPGVWAGADAMRADLDDFVEAVRAKYPGVPVYALGESMGGAVVLSSFATQEPPHVDGVILVAPAVWSRDDMPFYYGWAAWFMAHVFPSMHVSGSGLHIVACDNYDVLRKLSRDPLYQHSARSDQVYGLINLMDEGRQTPKHLQQSTPPILFMYGAHDQVIPAKPTEATIEDLGSRAEVHKDDNGYHMLLRDLDAQSQWQIVSDWIAKTNNTAKMSDSVPARPRVPEEPSNIP
jgi:alpha-beta hydrolase superfamily lysophospholipase